MAILGGTLGYKLLRWLSPRGHSRRPLDAPYETTSKLETFFGPSIWTAIAGKRIVDFGCGTGVEAVEMARRGAAHVLGLDIRESVLSEARMRAAQAGLEDRCTFTTKTNETFDYVVSLDAFEHFADPPGILALMRKLLKSTGTALIGFGPPWYHPRGGHLFSIFPWAHLVFTEKALLRWRGEFKDDGATRFAEVGGGLNQMTLRRFRQVIRDSDFATMEFEAVPIQKLRLLKNALSQEFLTSFVRCRLRAMPARSQQPELPATAVGHEWKSDNADCRADA